MKEKRFSARLIACLMAALMLVLSTPITQPALFGEDSVKASAASTTKSGTFAKTLKWSFNKLTGKLTISGKGAIPDYDYIDTTPPWSDLNVLSLEIKNGVTSIGANAFGTNLLITKISVADSVTYIEGGNFDSSIWYSTRKNGPVYLGKCLYSFIGSAKTVKIKDGTLSVSSGAFLLSEVGSVVIPNSVKKIGNSVFMSSTVTSVTFPSSLKKIPDNTFFYCGKLTKITIPKTVTAIGTSAFACSGLKSIDIPKNVKTIGDNAFGSCKKLSKVTLHNGLETIGERAFSYCAVESITIPASVKKITSSIFSGCKNLSKISVDKSSKYYVSDKSGALYNKAKTFLVDFPCGSKLTSYSVASTATTIGEFAFSESKLKKITLPSKLKAIDYGAFYSCESLAALNFPNSLRSVDDCGVEDTKWYENQPDGIIYLGKIAYVYKTETPEKVKEVKLKNGTYSLASSALSEFSSLTKLTLPESLKIIGDYSINGCSKLSEIKIPSGVTKIGEAAFGFCESLKTITLPKGITVIEEDLFSDCTALESIQIPSNVKSVNDSAFMDCTSLKSIVIPAKTTKIGASAFSGCEKLQSIKIMNPLCKIDVSSYMFLGLDTIPKSTQIIAHKGSEAQAYAKKYKNKFAALEAISLEKCAVKAIADQKYTGKAVTPSITVSYQGAALKSGKHFSAAFKNNTKKGTATVTIKGNEAYGFSGTKKLSFKIK